MVIAVLLPEIAASIQQQVQITRCVPLPALQDVFQLVSWQWGEQQMNMIGHHDEVAEFIASPIKMFPAIENDSLAMRISQSAGAMALVEVAVELAIEVFQERPLLLWIELNEAFGSLFDMDVMQTQPMQLFSFPLVEHTLGN